MFWRKFVPFVMESWRADFQWLFWKPWYLGICITPLHIVCICEAGYENLNWLVVDTMSTTHDSSPDCVSITRKMKFKYFRITCSLELIPGEPDYSTMAHSCHHVKYFPCWCSSRWKFPFNVFHHLKWVCLESLCVCCSILL